MMWAATSNDRKTDLVHVPGNLTAVRYINEIIQPHLRQVIDRQRELFQQDDTRPHTAVTTFGGVDRGSEVKVVAGAHVYPADPIGVQWDSSPTIWKATEAH
jgi:hypothetical protein